MASSRYQEALFFGEKITWLDPTKTEQVHLTYCVGSQRYRTFYISLQPRRKERLAWITFGSFERGAPGASSHLTVHGFPHIHVKSNTGKVVAEAIAGLPSPVGIQLRSSRLDRADLQTVGARTRSLHSFDVDIPTAECSVTAVAQLWPEEDAVLAAASLEGRVGLTWGGWIVVLEVGHGVPTTRVIIPSIVS